MIDLRLILKHELHFGITTIKVQQTTTYASNLKMRTILK